MKRFSNCVLILFSCIFASFSLFAAEDADMRIGGVDASAYPSMRMYIDIQDMEGKHINGVGPATLKFSIDGEAKSASNVSVSDFGSIGEPVSYNFIFSSNANLGSGLLNIQQQAIVNFKNSMRDGDEISVYTMGNRANAIIENVKKEDFDPTVVTSLKPTEENVKLYDCIADLVRMVKNKQMSRKVIIVISDQKDYRSGLTVNQFLDVIEKTGIPLYTVGIRAASSNVVVNLEQMSEVTKGKYFYSPNVRDIAGTLEEIVKCIRSTNVVYFTIKGVQGDERFHVLDVELNTSGYSGKSSVRFFAPRTKLSQNLINEIKNHANLETLLPFLSELPDINMRSDVNMTILHYAARYSDAEVVRFLVKQGADVYVSDRNGAIPLDYAAAFNTDAGVMTILAKLNNDTSVLNHALFEAATNNENPEVCRVLMDAGADVFTRDYLNMTVYRCALKNKNAKVAEYIWERMNL